MSKLLWQIIGLLGLAVCVPVFFLGFSKAEKGHQNSPILVSQAPVDRITNQQATSESDLHEVIENLKSGSPDYSNMEPMVRVALQEQKASAEEFLKKMGPIEKIEFKENDSGVDVYIIRFRNGRTIWEFGKSARGRIKVVAWNYLY
ncbi:MAG: hypothetical protein MRJ67_10620 [Nitrospirales bacterium]|nr:hypothetical protein [Nitrospirales bacterium]MDR4481738.1 hypothetical protein [Nitrospirales bacterium]